MKRTVFKVLLGVLTMGLAASSGWAQEGTPAVELKVGDVAPGFSLIGSDDVTYTLADFKGKKAVALAFFPKAFTPG